MKLRNKKTGEILDIDFIYPDTVEYFRPSYKLKDFIREWEDYEPGRKTITLIGEESEISCFMTSLYSLRDTSPVYDDIEIEEEE